MASIATVVRIKRPLGCDPPESILVSKRQKLEDKASSSDACTTLFMRLVYEEKNPTELEKSLKSSLAEKSKHSWQLRDTYKKGFQNSAKSISRNDVKSNITASRYKIICAKRHLLKEEAKLGKENEKQKEEKYTSSDIKLFEALLEEENESGSNTASSSTNMCMDVITCNNLPMQSEKVEYVYDLYYTHVPIQFSSWLDSICEIRPQYALELLPDEREPLTIEEIEDDDENDEDNWRNDYPDEDEDDLLHENEEDFLVGEMAKAKIYGSDSSYDENDFEEIGDFDENGSLINDGGGTSSMRPFQVFPKRTRTFDDLSDSD